MRCDQMMTCSCGSIVDDQGHSRFKEVWIQFPSYKDNRIRLTLINAERLNDDPWFRFELDDMQHARQHVISRNPIFLVVRLAIMQYRAYPQQ